MLGLAGELVETTTGFDPARCDRRFVLVASDYVAATLIPAVSRNLACLAPRASLVVRDLPMPRDGDVVAEALDYRRSDLVIVPQARINPRYPTHCCSRMNSAASPVPTKPPTRMA